MKWFLPGKVILRYTLTLKVSKIYDLNHRLIKNQMRMTKT
jgi:hypothetical protein